MTPVPDDLAAERADPHCLPPGRAAELLTGAPWRRLVLVGDSLAEGAGDPVPGYRSAPWAERLREVFTGRPGTAYLNLGRRGLRTAEVRDGQLAGALAFRPDLACVLAGGNDLLGRRFDAGEVAAALDDIVGPLRAAGSDVLLFTLMDFTYGQSEHSVLRRRLAALNDRVRDAARRHDALVTDMAEHPAGRDPGMFAGDGLHPSARGHAVIAAQVLRTLGRAPRRPQGLPGPARPLADRS
ncbi:SGNH/GDSL hydrolase family protein [Streptomyces cinereospinus]|uniref:SGNH/GDSL hydrolase family protein n=1 Tax=Streptomyces cinereospinus TaxID=285561 RepID=A0ABV5MXD9_9ACTN